MIEQILKAKVYDLLQETPLQRAEGLSRRLGNRVWIKREDLQPVFSFKARGAYNRIAHLSEQERERGVIAASAGNHAQGVALAAQHLGIRAVIVMPVTTPSIKVEAVRQRGARVELIGDTYDEAKVRADEIEKAEGLTYVHAFDDDLVIAGQGTVGQEILRQHPEPLDAIYVPVGGGGLIAGVAAFVKPLHPNVQIIGVEPQDAACMHAALEAGAPTTLAQVGIFADGVAVRRIGERPFAIAKPHVQQVITVSTDEICAAVKDIFDDNRSVAEPSGALAVAGMKRHLAETGWQGKSVVAIESGANMNFDRLRHVAERAELGERREALFGVTIPEQPGSFLRFCECLQRAPVTEFNYRYGDQSDAHVFVGVGLTEDNGHDQVRERLQGAGYEVLDMTDNEIAKTHVRFMVGGRARLEHERLYRFEFPERPGALVQFLAAMGERWNISLFHYRNHGAAWGRVLCGMQVPDKELGKLMQFLAELGYAYHDESDNGAYRMFLAGS